MVPVQVCSEEDLSRLKRKRLAQDAGEGSYTEIWISPEKQLVKLYAHDDETSRCFHHDIQNDKATLLTLSKSCNTFGPRFAFPERILVQGESIIGYVMPYMEGTSLSRIKSLSAAEFKEIICQLYRDIMYVDQETCFSFADIHEDNVIIGKDRRVYHIDLDGWYNGDGRGRRSRYIAMQREALLCLPGKYSIGPSGHLISDMNSDLFCLIHMVFNYLLHSDICFARLLEGEQRCYLRYISECCNGGRIASMFTNLFSKNSNYFDLDAVIRLPDDISGFSYGTFLKKTSRFKTDAAAEEFLRQNELRLKKLFPDRR